MHMARRINALEGKFNVGRIPAAERFKAVFSDEELEASREQIVTQYGADALRQITFIVFEDPFAEYR